MTPLKILFLLLIVSSHVIIALCKGDSSLRVNKLIEENKNPTTRVYEIYSKATGKRVQIRKRGVNANGVTGGQYAKIEISSISFGGVITIRGVKSGRYLCMDKRGRLVTKTRAKGKRCQFVEKIAENFFDFFVNVFNPNWYISFQNNGKPKKGPKTIYGRDDVMFLTYLNQRPPASGASSGSSFLDDEIWQDLEKRIRIQFLTQSYPETSKTKKTFSNLKGLKDDALVRITPTNPPEIEKQIEKRRRVVIELSSKEKTESNKKEQRNELKKISMATTHSHATTNDSEVRKPLKKAKKGKHHRKNRKEKKRRKATHRTNS